MKILNQTTRDTELPFETTPVTGLEKMDDLPPSSLMHIVRYDEITGGYDSRKMLVSSFQNKMYQAIQNTFKTEYIDTHAHGDDTSVSSFPSMVQYLGNELPEFNPSDRDSSFVQHVNYDFEILKRYIVKKDAEILGKIGSITKTMHNADVRFQTNMKLTTTDENGATTDVSVWEKKGPDQQYCQMQIQVGNKISNEWIVPASGNLVICGWLDSEKALNNKSIPTSYCVIEGKIGEWVHDSSEEGTCDKGEDWIRRRGEVWSVLQRTGRLRHSLKQRAKWIQVPGVLQRKHRRWASGR